MHQTRKFLVLLFLVSFVTCQAATLKPVLNIDHTSPNFSPESTTVTYSGGWGLGLGGLLEFDGLPLFSIETGLLLTPYRQQSESSGVTSMLSWKVLHIPFGLRLNLLPILSLGAGGYYGFALGDANLAVTSGGTTTESSTTLADQAKSDYGIYGSLGLNFPLGPTLGLVIDTRLLIGLKDQSSSSAVTAKVGHLEFLVGVSFSI